MPKPLKKSKRHKKHKKHHTKKMHGGDFSNDDRQELTALGFTNDNINMFQENGIDIALIRMSLNQINPQTGVQYTPQEIVQVTENIINETNDDENESVISDIPNNENEQHNLDDENDNNFNLDDSLNTTRENVSNDSENENSENTDLNLSQGSLHLSDLNVDDENDENNQSMNTTNESTVGGKRRKSKKSRKNKKTRKSKKSRKNKKRRGGGCYGNGIGANSSNPNFSIYNTRQLHLFPYSPK